MTDDLLARLRVFHEYDPEKSSLIRESANRIEYLERELEQERQSRIVASERGWVFADRLKRMVSAFEAISVSDDLVDIHKIARKALSPEP